MLFLNSLWMFLLIMPVVVPFLSEHGLEMEQIFILQSIFALCIVSLEVPSGYLADLFGRRRSLILAGVFHGIGFTVLAFAETFTGFILFEVFAALGSSFFSGSDVALLYDTEEALGEKERGVHNLGRRLLWGQIGETIAAPLGGALALGGLHWPAYANAVVAWTPLIVALTLVEPPRTKLSLRHRENFGRILRVIFCTSPVLRRTFFSLVVYGLATLLAVWVFQGYWRELGISVGWFGVLWAAYNLTVALVGRLASRAEERWGARSVITVVALCPIVGYGGMALSANAQAPSFVWVLAGVLAGFAFQVGRGLNQVVIKGALNVRVPPELRATANSLSSLGVRIFFVLLGPALGWGVDTHGYRDTLAIAAACFVGCFLFVALPLLRSLSDSDHRNSDRTTSTV